MKIRVGIRVVFGTLMLTLAKASLAAGPATPLDLYQAMTASEIELGDSAFWSVPVTLIDGAKELKADFVAPSGWLDFNSTTAKTGEVNVSATVSIAGLITRLEAVVAADQKSVTWTGHGGSLTKESAMPSGGSSQSLNPCN